MPAPCNACPVEFPDSLGTPLGIQQGGPISPGSTPWNEIRPKKYLSAGIPVVPLWQNSWNVRYAISPGSAPCNACPVEFPDFSGTPLGIQQGEPISLGIYNPNMRFFKKAPPAQCSWSFFISLAM